MSTDVRYTSSRRLKVEVDGSGDSLETLHMELAKHPLNLDTFELEDKHVLANGRVVFSLRRLTHDQVIAKFGHE